MKFSKITALAATAAITGCATPPPPPEAAALQFTPIIECTESFSAAAAVDMTPEAPEGITVRRVVLGSDSPCLSADGAPVPYALYKLPIASNVASINAGSVFEPVRILGAQVQILDADLSTTRSFSADNMLHRGSTLSVLVRPKPNEQYIAIVADRGLTNNSYNRSRPQAGNTKSLDRVDYSLLGGSFVRVYYYDPDEVGTDS